jgi:hypothetical protein
MVIAPVALTGRDDGPKPPVEDAPERVILRRLTRQGRSSPSWGELIVGESGPRRTRRTTRRADATPPSGPVLAVLPRPDTDSATLL